MVIVGVAPDSLSLWCYGDTGYGVDEGECFVQNIHDIHI